MSFGATNDCCESALLKKKTNEWVLEKMEVEERLLTTLNRRKMAFVGHILRGKDISTDLFMRMVYGKRGRGRPKTRYSDNVKEITGDGGFTDLYRLAQDRKLWRATVVINMMMILVICVESDVISPYL